MAAHKPDPSRPPCLRTNDPKSHQLLRWLRFLITLYLVRYPVCLPHTLRIIHDWRAVVKFGLDFPFSLLKEESLAVLSRLPGISSRRLGFAFGRREALSPRRKQTIPSVLADVKSHFATSFERPNERDLIGILEVTPDR